MDQSALVGQQIDAGQQLIEQLVAEGQPIQSAFWARTSDDENWYLYIATELVDRIGSLETYRVVRAALQKLKPSWVSLSEVKVISPEDPTSQEVVSIVKRGNSPLPTRVGSRTLGRIAVDQAYLYPDAMATRSHSVAP